MAKVEINKVYKCKFCKVRVVGPTDTRAIIGKEHSKHCRRRFK